MTAEFNITIPGAEIIKRLADLETANADLLDRLKQLELTVSANAHQQDALHDRFIALERNNESIGAYIQRVETSAGEDTNKLRRELNLALANGHEEIKQVNNRLDRNEGLISDLIERGDRLTDFVNGKTTHTPNYPANAPEPPVDTSWHPYDVDVGYTWGEPPTGNKRVMVMQRTSTAISGPFPASSIYWGEQGEFTIVAWRYAKEGE